MPIDDRDAGPAQRALSGLWRQAGLPAAALDAIDVPGHAPVLPSSFAVADAIQASMAAAAAAAAELWHLRHGRRQRVLVPREHAVLESCAHFTLDGRAPQVWDKLSGLYRCGEALGEPGWVRLHANFAHHRDGALKLLGCPTGDATERPVVEQALRGWRAEDVEDAAAQAGLVVAALRSFEAWDRHPQALALADQPTVRIERIGDAAPLAWPDAAAADRPLHGLRVLDLTRILAGPVAGRTLAAYGAEVLLLNAPQLPNIEAIAETSRGKRSAHLDLRDNAGRQRLKALLADAQVFVQGYRPGGLQALGFGPEQLAALRPGIVAVSLSAYGSTGPWSARRGFDSLVQTATGFNDAEARAAGAAKPQALPLQALDYAAGYLLAFGAQAALWRQACEGGSWHVQVSLAGVGHWLRSLGRVDHGLTAKAPDIAPLLVSEPSGFGRLVAARHAAQFAETPPLWRWPSMPPGTHPAAWPTC
ncbi:CoA transferase [Rhizobacter sp. OV335]|uniref:CoA transferase n=1 Tax=Rhizobacter sp. OV335 TaxID=1500264 RepID=UPI000922900F|nr:CoA transferase [Rhizobacter sp. OV335]SHM26705.1 CoA-transferase family III [Rhizobacter sp. OV335]